MRMKNISLKSTVLFFGLRLCRHLFVRLSLSLWVHYLCRYSCIYCLFGHLFQQRPRKASLRKSKKAREVCPKIHVLYHISYFIVNSLNRWNVYRISVINWVEALFSRFFFYFFFLVYKHEVHWCESRG